MTGRNLPGFFLFLCVVACGDDGDRPDTGVVDAAPDAAADAGDDAGPAAMPRALILDTELRHVSTWVDVVEGLRAAGLEPHYRRFFPHLTPSDVDPPAEGAGLPHQIVILAAGRAPGSPASFMRLEETQNAARFVRAGGVLVLAAQSGLLDSPAGENDWFVQNRILEELGVSMRIGRGIVIGDVYTGEPPEPHVPVPEGYPTTLEPTLGYAYARTAREHPTGARVAQVACGSAPPIRVGGDDVEVLLRTYPYDYLWQRLGGPAEARVLFLEDEEPMAAAAPAGDGYVVALGRSLLTLGAVTGALSDKPAHDAGYEAAARDFVHDLLQWLADLAADRVPFEVVTALGNDALFSVAAPGLDPLEPDGDVIMVTSAIDAGVVPAAPPDGMLEETVGRLDDGQELPDWFHPTGGRIAYGGLPPDRAQMATAFGEIEDHGLDALMTSTSPERLIALAGMERDRERMVYADVSGLATAASARWLIGGYYITAFGERPEDFIRMVGPQGQEVNAPAPLDPLLWDEAIVPAYRTAGELARDYPGVFGYHLDLELYGGPVFHADGYAFSDAEVAAFLGASDGEPIPELATTRPERRLDLLVDRGRLGDYFATLEELAYDRGVQCRQAAHAAAPELWLMVYAPLFPSTWFYHGFLRGLGSEQRPVIVLTYEAWADRPRRVMNTEGVRMVHLGGALVGYFRPSELDDVLATLGRGNDGYWYLSFNDFSVTNPMPPMLHADGASYWSAVENANALLER